MSRGSDAVLAYDEEEENEAVDKAMEVDEEEEEDSFLAYFDSVNQ